MDPKQNTNTGEIEKLIKELNEAKPHLPGDLYEKAAHQIERIALSIKYSSNFGQIDITDKYIDWISHLPWDITSKDELDVTHAKTVLDKNHYGLDKIKSRVLEYLSVLILQKQNLKADTFHAPILFFVGLAGTGKTTFAFSVAEALKRQFIRIPFGGLSSALDLRGQSKVSPEAEPGMIVRGLRQAQTKNPVILLDELDRVTPESRSAIMGVLIELLDPKQNRNFTDYFLDYPFDLSQVLFIATANNTNAISTAVMDRMEVIQMPSYTDQEKIEIAKAYILPRYLKDSGLTESNIKIVDEVWAKITRPLGFDAGIRTLERTIESIVRKVAYQIVSGQGNSYIIDDNNYKHYIS